MASSDGLCITGLSTRTGPSAGRDFLLSRNSCRILRVKRERSFAREKPRGILAPTPHSASSVSTFGLSRLIISDRTNARHRLPTRRPASQPTDVVLELYRNLVTVGNGSWTQDHSRPTAVGLWKDVAWSVLESLSRRDAKPSSLVSGAVLTKAAVFTGL